jgi:hypothetical protein
MEENRERVTGFISQYLERAGNTIDKKGVEQIIHYLEHNEYEIAFEGLLLEIIESKVVLQEFKDAKNIALELGLDKDSVLIQWSKFPGFYDEWLATQRF